MPHTGFLPHGYALENEAVRRRGRNRSGRAPEVAAAWYPVNDHPQDPASYAFAVSVPAGLTAMCNGVLLAKATKNGWTTWRWAQFTPMVSYLATATIGQFALTTTVHNGRPTYIAIDPGLPAGFADDAVGRTDEITDFLAQRFGPYPFEANGAIVDDGSPAPGDPGAEFLFDASVYLRGAMTLHALRRTVGDGAFWTIVRRWAAERRYSSGDTGEFIALSEQVSGMQLDDLFNAWLFTEGKPAYPGGPAPTASATAAVPTFLKHSHRR